jgi:hypothetical protein
VSNILKAKFSAMSVPSKPSNTGNLCLGTFSFIECS